MPVGCISTSITRATQRDWPQTRKGAQKSVVSTRDLQELCFSLFFLKLISLSPSLGNVYIHPTANIDPTAVVWISDSCAEDLLPSPEEWQHVFFPVCFSWAPMCPLAPGWPLVPGSEWGSPSSFTEPLCRWSIVFVQPFPVCDINVWWVMLSRPSSDVIFDRYCWTRNLVASQKMLFLMILRLK